MEIRLTVMVQLLQIHLEGSKLCVRQRETLGNGDAQLLRHFDLSQRKGSLLASLSTHWFILALETRFCLPLKCSTFKMVSTAPRSQGHLRLSLRTCHYLVTETENKEITRSLPHFFLALFSGMHQRQNTHMTDPCLFLG